MEANESGPRTVPAATAGEGSRTRIRKVETFAALRLEVDSWRWKGVPFYIRAGKCLPVTCTEVLARLRKPPTVVPESELLHRTISASASAPR